MIDKVPNRKTFHDDNVQRAQEIVSMWRALSKATKKNFFKRRNTTDLSSEEKAKVLGMVSRYGVNRAANEFELKKKIIVRWLSKEHEYRETASPKREKKLLQPQSPLQSRENIPSNLSVDTKVHEAVYEVPNDTPQASEKASESNKVAHEAPQIIKTEEPRMRKRGVKPVGSVDTTGPLKKTKDFTAEEKEHILQRAELIGDTKAAREAGTTRWIIINWKKALKNAGKADKTSEVSKASKILRATGKKTRSSVGKKAIVAPSTKVQNKKLVIDEIDKHTTTKEAVSHVIKNIKTTNIIQQSFTTLINIIIGSEKSLVYVRLRTAWHQRARICISRSDPLQVFDGWKNLNS